MAKNRTVSKLIHPIRIKEEQRALESCENYTQNFLGQKRKRQVLSCWDKPKKEEITIGSVVGNPVTQ